MTIKRKPKAVQTVEDFVSGAPDAGAASATAAAGEYDRGVKKGNKRQISLTIAPDLLRRVDEVRFALGVGREQMGALDLLRLAPFVDRKGGNGVKTQKEHVHAVFLGKQIRGQVGMEKPQAA